MDTCSDCHAAELAAKDKEIAALKEQLRYEKDAGASNYFAYLDMQKYAYRVGHKDECFKKDAEIARLRAALQEIAGFDCACFEDDSCAACLAILALEAE
jgi:hypothetical protein